MYVVELYLPGCLFNLVRFSERVFKMYKASHKVHLDL